MAARLIPFSPLARQALAQAEPVDDKPVSKAQAEVLEQALNVAFTAWADANPLEQSESEVRLPSYYEGYVGLAFRTDFGCESVATLPARLYPAALFWIAQVTERIELPDWWLLPGHPRRGW